MSRAAADGRRRPTQERARVTVDRILRSSVELIDEFGYGAVTMTQISARAQVGIATLYQWFPTKDDIVSELAERHLSEAVDALGSLAERLRKTTLALDEVLRQFIDATVRLHGDDRRFHHELFARCPRTEIIDGQVESLTVLMIDELCWHLDRLQLGGPGVRLRAELAVRSLDTVVHEVVIQRPKGRARNAAIAGSIALVAGYLARP